MTSCSASSNTLVSNASAPLLRAPENTYENKRAPLTDEQQAKVAKLRAHVDSLRLGHDDPYYPYENAFLSEATLHRYLRARKWDYEGARRQIEESVRWRREYKPELIPPEEVEPEVNTGKLYLNGFDLAGRPTMYMKPRNENTKPSSRQIRNVVFNLERATRIMPEGVETVNIIIDFKGASTTNTPGLTIAKEFLYVLGTQFPERLGYAFCVHTPWFFLPFFKLVSPFIDPVTRQKIKFVSNVAHPTSAKAPKERADPKKQTEVAYLPDFYSADQLEKDFGGDFDFKFDFEEYWRSLLERTGDM